MAKTFLCTTGTSIAQGCAALRPYQQRPSAWHDATGELDAEIAARLAQLDLSSAEDRVRASAELNVLHRLGPTPDDEVVLFGTDTADGRACAEAVRDVLVGPAFGMPAHRVRIERVVGLQVRDAEQLRRQGLPNFTRLLITYLDDPQRRWSGGCVLCPNGGFKGVVPFLTLLGMVYRAPVVYVFEFAETLIRLPPLPIGLAADLFDRALPALRWAADAGVFQPAEFHRRVAGCTDGERDLFEGFLEQVDDDGGRALACLSPLADAWMRRESGSNARLWMSREAAAALGQVSGPARTEIEDHLRKLASPLWRSQHIDRKFGNDLEFYPRGHNPWRFAGHGTEQGFRVCWFARHDAYLRELPAAHRQSAAFAEQTFTELVLPPASVARRGPLQGAPSDESASWLDLREQRDEARAETHALAAMIRDRQIRHDAEVRQQREQLRQAREALDAAQRAFDKATGPVQAVEDAAATWKGLQVLARVVEVRPGSLVFAALGGPEGLPAITAPRGMFAPLALGEQAQLLITGFNGRLLQAVQSRELA